MNILKISKLGRRTAQELQIWQFSLVWFVDQAARRNVWRFAFTVLLASFGYFSYCLTALLPETVTSAGQKNLQTELRRTEVEQIKVSLGRIEKAVGSVLAFDRHFKQSFVSGDKKPIQPNALKESADLIKAARYDLGNAAATIDGTNFQNQRTSEVLGGFKKDFNLIDERLAVLNETYDAPKSDANGADAAFIRFKAAYAKFLEALRTVSARFTSYDGLADSLNRETAVRAAELKTGEWVRAVKISLLPAAMIYCLLFFLCAFRGTVRFLPAGFRKWKKRGTRRRRRAASALAVVCVVAPT